MSDKDSLLAVQSYSGKTSSGSEAALDITRLPVVAQSGNEQFKELIRALNIIAQHAHIEVDIGKGPLDARVFSLIGSMAAITNAIFPLLNRQGYHATLEWRNESGSSYTKNRLKQVLPDLESRYKDFPDLICALDHIANLSDDLENVKQFFRDNLTPEQMSQLFDMYDATFRGRDFVTIQLPETANEQGKSEPKRVQRAFPIQK